MTNREIYRASLSILGEPEETAADYESRAPYLLGAVIASCQRADAAYRQANGLGTGEEISSLCLELDEAFPLSDRFAMIAAFYLASLLIIGENDALSDRCMAQVREEMDWVTRRECPGVVEATKQLYPL